MGSPMAKLKLAPSRMPPMVLPVAKAQVTTVWWATYGSVTVSVVSRLWVSHWRVYIFHSIEWSFCSLSLAYESDCAEFGVVSKIQSTTTL